MKILEFCNFPASFFFFILEKKQSKKKNHTHWVTQTGKETKCHPKEDGKVPSNIINARVSSCMIFYEPV